MLNKAILIGRLGKDPEIKDVNGTKVASFPLATDNSYKDKEGNKVERTDWHNIQYWGKTAEVVEKYVKKGNLIYVEGQIQTRSYEKDGQTKYITEITGKVLTMMSNSSEETKGKEPDDLPF